MARLQVNSPPSEPANDTEFIGAFPCLSVFHGMQTFSLAFGRLERSKPHEEERRAEKDQEFPPRGLRGVEQVLDVVQWPRYVLPENHSEQLDQPLHRHLSICDSFSRVRDKILLAPSQAMAHHSLPGGARVHLSSRCRS